MKQLWRNYNLSVVLASLFLSAGASDLDRLAPLFRAEQHNQPGEFFGQSGYVWHWGDATLENWQSEFLQLLTFVVLTTYLIHRGSHEFRGRR